MQDPNPSNISGSKVQQSTMKWDVRVKVGHVLLVVYLVLADTGSSARNDSGE